MSTTQKLITLGQFKTGLESAKTYIDTADASLSARIDEVVADVEGIVATGGEANILEGVKVNGTAMQITDKMVDILIAAGEENGTLSVNGAAVAITGLAALAYKSEISEDELSDALKASIAAKATQADLTALTVRVGSIESAGYQTAEQVAAAITDGIANANHLKYEIVAELPSAADADATTWYMLYNEDTEHYDIYGLLNGEVRIIDDTTIDLTGYSTTEAMQAWVNQQITALNVDQYATDAELQAVIVDVTAIQTALANYYTAEEAEAKFTDEAEAQAIAESAAAAAIENNTATDDEATAAIDEVFDENT